MSLNRPRISVIMPVYNAAPYLRRALDSVCNQTLKDLEILCINDGSTDESPAILAEYAARDARIRLIDHGENRGYARAINSGLEAARGEALGFVDSDDVVGKNFFGDLWAVYAAEGCDIAKGRLVERDTTGIWRETDLNANIKKNNYTFSWQWTSAIYRTDFIQKHNLKLSTQVPCGQDLIFLYSLMGHEPKINFSDTAIYYYFRNDASMTKSHPDDYYLDAHIRIAELLKQYLPVYPTEIQRRKVFERIVDFLDFSLNGKFSQCDVSPHLPEILNILVDDQDYAPQKDFPFLRMAHQVKNTQELKLLLKSSSKNIRQKHLVNSLREKLQTKPT